jgi:formate transporter
VAAVYYTGLMGNAGNPSNLGQLAAAIADKKIALPFWQSFVRGILCNMLVILAIILSYFSKDVVSKIFCCVLPIMVFVASGFEHCVANMYFLPVGLTIKGVPLVQQWVMFKNLIPVTLGNIVGGIFILVIHPNRIHQLVFLINSKKNASDKTAR